MRICKLLILILCLLPAASLAVTENVVEAAPSIAVELPELTDALFGAWEEGLKDIQTAARGEIQSVLRNPTEGLELTGMRLNNSARDEDPANDTITVSFQYRENGVRMLLHVRYLRGTGELTQFSHTRYMGEGGFVQEEGVPLGRDVLRDAARYEFERRYGLTGLTFVEESVFGEDTRWEGQYRGGDGRAYEIVLDRITGALIRMTMNAGPENKSL